MPGGPGALICPQTADLQRLRREPHSRHRQFPRQVGEEAVRRNPHWIIILQLHQRRRRHSARAAVLSADQP